MSSTRLPGKVMMPFAGKTFLDHCLERCARIDGISEVIVATPDGADCDALTAAVSANGFRVFRGSETDVLSRYLGAARMGQADAVMRITSDCPLIDPDVAAQVLARYRQGDVDLATTNIPPSWPNGLDVEVFSMTALEEAAAKADTKTEREHVSTYIRRRPARFRLSNLSCAQEGCAHWRMTLDTAADHDFITALAAAYEGDIAYADWPRLHALIASRPDLVAINTDDRI